MLFCCYRQAARPMTSNRGAGFSSNPKGRFDPFGQANKGLASAGGSSSLLPRKQAASTEEVARGMEKKVHEVLEASVLLSQQGGAQAGQQVGCTHDLSPGQLLPACHQA
eukprot:GHRQ01027400.1.p2 GENE.GHRQ01027400.1~~GHRQ01027400.1.p2  ORF type:complete len:109 (-),score=46.64 GHRQ01027400.1:542-868(-)